MQRLNAILMPPCTPNSAYRVVFYVWCVCVDCAMCACVWCVRGCLCISWVHHCTLRCFWLMCSFSSAYDSQQQMKVAIKKLARPFQSPIHAKRAYREIRMLKHMWHENVRDNNYWLHFPMILSECQPICPNEQKVSVQLCIKRERQSEYDDLLK